MTIQELEAKEKQLTLEMSAALESAKKQKPATDAFDVEYSKYLAAKDKLAKIPAEMLKARQDANSDALKVVGVTVAQGIAKLCEGLKVAELLGEPVKVVRYIVNDDGTPIVGFNPTIRISTKGKTERKPSSGHTQIIAPDGTKQSLTKFVRAFATDAEKASKEFKYPHTIVDTKAKFDVFCIAHSLTGYLYEVAQAPQSEATS